MKNNLHHPELSGETTVESAITKVAAMVGENVKLRGFACLHCQMVLSALIYIMSPTSFIVSILNKDPDPEKGSVVVQEFFANMEVAFRSNTLWVGSSDEELESSGLGHNQSTLPIKTCLLKNFRKKVVAIGRMNTDAPLNDEAYNIIVDEIFDGNEMFDRDGKFDDITVGEMINWPKYSVQFVRF